MLTLLVQVFLRDLKMKMDFDVENYITYKDIEIFLDIIERSENLINKMLHFIDENALESERENLISLNDELTNKQSEILKRCNFIIMRDLYESLRIGDFFNRRVYEKGLNFLKLLVENYSNDDFIKSQDIFLKEIKGFLELNFKDPRIVYEEKLKNLRINFNNNDGLVLYQFDKFLKEEGLSIGFGVKVSEKNFYRKLKKMGIKNYLNENDLPDFLKKFILEKGNKKLLSSIICFSIYGGFAFALLGFR